MEFLLIFNSSIIPIFIIIGIAFIYNRLFQPDIRQITDIALSVFAPIFLFDVLIKHNITIDMIFAPIIFMCILTTALIAIAYCTAKLLKADEDEQLTLMQAGAMINVGNFGLPLIYFTFNNGSEAYSILYFAAFNIPLTTVSIYLSSREKNLPGILKDVAKVPLFHAMALALVFTGASITIPASLSKCTGLIGQAAIPLLIFVLGLQLSNIKLKKGFIKIIVPAVIIRLILSPVIAKPVLELLSITGLEQNVALVQTSAPCALLPLMYAIRFNRSPDLLAAIIFITTLFSGISLTFLIKFL